MNYQQQLELLRRYQVQNPVKYKQKFGDVMPEMAANKLLGLSAPTGILGTTVEVKTETPKALEVQFTDISGTVVSAVVPATPIMEVKRGRKPKNA